MATATTRSAGAEGTRAARASPPPSFGFTKHVALACSFFTERGYVGDSQQGGFSKMVRYRIGLLALVAACAPLAWVLPASAQRSTAKITTVNVTAGKPAEFRFTLSTKTSKSGIIVFK